jgi:hypothetical protein
MTEDENNYTDCEKILDGHSLWRRIMPEQVIYDENLKRNRPSSAAFENCADGDPMSVFWQEFHIENGLTIDHILKGHESFFVASFRAGLARELKQILHHDPLDASENLDAQPAHVLVVGDKPKKGFSKKVAKDSSWVIETPAKADAV